MTIEDSKAIPEILEKSLLRDLDDDKSRAKAFKVISHKSSRINLLFVLLAVLVNGFISTFMNHIIKSTGLQITGLEEGILFGLLASIPWLIFGFYYLDRRVNAIIQLLLLDKK
jgi:hypothetical protein